MQSRLARIAKKSNSVFSPSLNRRFVSPQRLSSTTTATPPGDPEVHSTDHGNNPALFYAKPEISQEKAEPENTKATNYSSSEEETETVHTGAGTTEPFTPPKPGNASSSSPRLENIGVNRPLDPMYQQKRSHATAVTLEGVSCTGLDGSPWPEQEVERKRERREQEEDDKEYFEHHKASPLSEILIADTRKPIQRAMDATADSAEHGRGKDVIGWRPEQLLSAEETLLGAAEMWRRNAMRGDPDLPHSRVLRALRGESF